MVPHPEQPNRLLAWFSHGSFEVNDDEHDQQTWRHVLERTMAASAFQSTSPTRLEVEADGKLSFQIPRNDDARESMYLDVLYLDDTIRVLRGNRGTIFVMARVPYFPDE